ncbi:MAG TPA: CPBP family intramembrane glutamic endopeptidase [Candidatus Peribacteraceae bacterium]|nr:CPBP family intramembrane glutamic endopeptidase [Candidatus Peribacteraceae bacterium]
MNRTTQDNFLTFRPVGILTPLMQIAIIALLYAFTAFLLYKQRELHGTLFPYPILISILLAPLYEEIILRGWIFPALLRKLPTAEAVILTSALSALVYLTNIWTMDTAALIERFLLMGCVIAPALCLVTLKARSVWPAVILRYVLSLLLGLSLWTIVALVIVL